jgi:FkbM family methyltransferase
MSQTGSLFANRTSDFHAYPFSVHGYYEWRNVAIASAICSKGDSIVEIGANVGTETTGYADIVGPKGKVYAFEPVASNIVALENTLRISGLFNVTVLPLAVQDVCGNVKFVLPGKGDSSGVGHISSDGEGDLNEVKEVDSVTLDSVSEWIGPAKAILVDAEGSELHILQGGKGYIKRYKPFMVLEASSKLLERTGSDLDQLYQQIRELGYCGFQITRVGLRKLDSNRLPKKSNWFCCHQTHLDSVRIVRKILVLCGSLPFWLRLNPLGRTRIL